MYEYSIVILIYYNLQSTNQFTIVFVKMFLTILLFQLLNSSASLEEMHK